MHYIIGFVGFLSLAILSPLLWSWSESGRDRTRRIAAYSVIATIGLASAILMTGHPTTDDCFRISSRVDALCY
jgi:hypothetical protein